MHRALTAVYGRLEGEIAPLHVEGELVNVHPAGADQHLIVVGFNISFIIDGDIRSWRSFVLLCPACNHMEKSQYRIKQDGKYCRMLYKKEMH